MSRRFDHNCVRIEFDFGLVDMVAQISLKKFAGVMSISVIVRARQPNWISKPEFGCPDILFGVYTVAIHSH